MPGFWAALITFISSRKADVGFVALQVAAG